MSTRDRTVTRSSSLPPRPATTRLTLTVRDAPGSDGQLDGTWWPQTMNLADEAPGLLSEMSRRGLRVTRLTYNATLWDPAPRRLTADGRVVRLGSFTTLDSRVVGLSQAAGQRRLQLRVVPPDAPGETAGMTAGDGVAPEGPETGDWDSEGGHARR